MSSSAPRWRVIKSYGAEEGLSCAFRQWQAVDSHCRYVHGYALSFRFHFACASLDDRQWCVDFGGLKPLRAWLHEVFDHTLLVAADDPAMAQWRALEAAGLARVRVLPAVGCEAFAAHAWAWASAFVARETGGRAWLDCVEVSEHAGNTACFLGEQGGRQH